METLRSSFTPDGQRVFLMFDEKNNNYKLATRWSWLANFDNVFDACDAFECIELMDGDLCKAAKFSKSEIKRTPSYRFGINRNKMTRINYLINCIEHRIAGKRPMICGSKGSVEKWV